jgi:hypothetical protein
MPKPFDTKPLEQRKNKTNPYYCSTCGDVATAKALFQGEEGGGSIIIMRRFCERCLSAVQLGYSLAE